LNTEEFVNIFYKIGSWRNFFIFGNKKNAFCRRKKTGKANNQETVELYKMILILTVIG